jgi:RNA polymerase primary sigma factor
MVKKTLALLPITVLLKRQLTIGKLLEATAKKETLILFESDEGDQPFPSRVPLTTEEQELLLGCYYGLRNCDGKLRGDCQDEQERYSQFERVLQRAKSLLFLSNQRLVFSIAKNFRDRGVPIYDLFQQGNLGLLTAISKFDLTRGFRFSTYATCWVRSQIQREVRNSSSTVRVPSYVYDLQTREKNGMEVTLLERESISLFGNTRRGESLDNAYYLEGEENLKFYGYFSVASDDNVEEDVVLGELREEIGKVLETIDARREKILRLRYGLCGNGEDQMTLEEVGKKMGVTRERVRQLEKEALERLRRSRDKRSKLAVYY